MWGHDVCWVRVFPVVMTPECACAMTSFQLTSLASLTSVVSQGLDDHQFDHRQEFLVYYQSQSLSFRFSAFYGRWSLYVGIGGYIALLVVWETVCTISETATPIHLQSVTKEHHWYRQSE